MTVLLVYHLLTTFYFIFRCFDLPRRRARASRAPGYWVVLDELNLAPSDVLEALNRLLDDNRELFVPEYKKQ